MLQRLQKRKILFAAVFLVASGAVVTGLTIVDDNPDGYKLGVETLSPNDVAQTQATFRANVTELDPIYDAALVYWNYTDGTNEYKGPANITFNPDTVVTGRQTGLSGATGYDIEAYAEPVIWGDETLMSNIANSSRAIRGVLAGEFVLQEVWKKDIPSKETLESFESGSDSYSIVDNQYSNGKALKIKISQTRYTSNTYKTAERDLDLSGISTLEIQTKSSSGGGSNELFIKIGGNKVLSVGNHGWTNRSFDVSSYSGKTKLVLGSSNYEKYYGQKAYFSAIQLRE